MPQFDDIPLGWSLPRRKKYLEDLADTRGRQSKYSWPLKFQNRHNTFDVYIVPLDLPKYRLENGRTQAAQEDHLAKHPNLPTNFFRLDKESDQAQLVQHELLYEMLEKNNLLPYFKDRDNKQTEPLILSNEGYVVNGNRRLCAMRTLFRDDREKYDHFANIEVVILPKCTSQDIDELEAYLQIQQDIKADYTWISEACMLRARQEEHNYNDETLALIYGKTEKEIKAISQRLVLVDEYLHYVSKERQYDIVEESEYAFKQIQKMRPTIKEENLRDLFTHLSFILIENSSDVSGRLYERIPDVKENFSEIIKQLPNEIEIPEEKPPVSGFDLFGPPQPQVSPITQAISKHDNKSKVVDVVINVIENKKEQDRLKKKTSSVLNEVSQANTHLHNAVSYLSELSVSKEGVQEQFDAIVSSMKIIKKWLDKE